MKSKYLYKFVMVPIKLTPKKIIKEMTDLTNRAGEQGWDFYKSIDSILVFRQLRDKEK